MKFSKFNLIVPYDGSKILFGLLTLFQTTF